MKVLLTFLISTCCFISSFGNENILNSIGDDIKSFSSTNSSSWYHKYRSAMAPYDWNKANRNLETSEQWICFIYYWEGGVVGDQGKEVSILTCNDGEWAIYSEVNWSDKEIFEPKVSEALSMHYDLCQKIEHNYSPEVFESICSKDIGIIAMGNKSTRSTYLLEQVDPSIISQFFLNGENCDLIEYVIRHPNYRNDKNAMTLYDQIIFLGTYELVYSYTNNDEHKQDRIQRYKDCGWPITIAEWEASLNEDWKTDLPKQKPATPVRYPELARIFEQLDGKMISVDRIKKTEPPLSPSEYRQKIPQKRVKRGQPEN